MRRTPSKPATVAVPSLPFSMSRASAWPAKFLPMNSVASGEPPMSVPPPSITSTDVPGRRATVRANSPIHCILIDARTTPRSEPSSPVIRNAAMRPGASCTRLIR
jgi:hypothetical protein